mgnify:CR=1 FL=1
MKTSLLFTAILATSLFATAAQAQNASASGNAQASAQGSLQADGSAAKAVAPKSAQTAANAQGQASSALQHGVSTATQTSTKAATQAATTLDATGNKLAQRYAEAAGSVAAAADIVGDLHSGADGQAAMSYGSTDNTLPLASHLVADGNAANLDAGVDAVLDLRADGLGWGKVAQQLGYHLGSVVSAAHDTGAQVGRTIDGTVSTAGGTLSSVTSGLAPSNRVGIHASTSQGSVNVGADAAASARARTERPSLDAQGSGRLNIGVDARPSLPLVRPLLGH